MKNHGKVTEYNGVYGNILGNDGNDYKLLDKNLMDENIQVSDEVEFEAEDFKTPEIEIKIARFVRVLKKK